MLRCLWAWGTSLCRVSDSPKKSVVGHEPWELWPGLRSTCKHISKPIVGNWRWGFLFLRCMEWKALLWVQNGQAHLNWQWVSQAASTARPAAEAPGVLAWQHHTSFTVAAVSLLSVLTTATLTWESFRSTVFAGVFAKLNVPQRRSVDCRHTKSRPKSRLQLLREASTISF